MSNRITETSNKKSLAIDEMNSLEIVSLMNTEDAVIAPAVRGSLPDIAKGIDGITEAMNKGGRCFVVGAGTSGRLAVVDAIELIPTFSIRLERWQPIIAGGEKAMWASLEQDEDKENASVEELEAHSFGPDDCLIGVSASGSTPFVLSALQYGKKKAAFTIAVSSNHGAKASSIADVSIEVETGPEVIRGSTRLKSGTAQKMILNMLSTGTMVKLGRVYKNEMVDMQIINKKLVGRAVEMVMELASVDYGEAERLLRETDQNLKAAIFIGITGATKKVAFEELNKSKGHLKKALKTYLG
ncbi:N-acetylmuramic acid 6-phosphate etherase [Evansella tamaricis]|uniref:N-acetylmuramic acid 6-phosphate etherase n=1 Tax=Evansella tamaricis TaxID=2069301 RepID=A0ABS6JHC7_9BACI|nr:N-acetylmuramic acid 6-phosphate etherase [Evansella tamaricis]MBU9711875.1 N-acetylmuramic acid 6-phosphate etherase [Evansella tamaricis]